MLAIDEFESDPIDALLAGDPDLTYLELAQALLFLDPRAYRSGRPPEAAATMPAGTELKIKLIEERVLSGRTCFHPADPGPESNRYARKGARDRNGAGRRAGLSHEHMETVR